MEKIEIVLEDDSKDVLKGAEDLYHALVNLRYEGKLYRGTNLKRLGETLEVISKRIKIHISFQEAVLFPYLKIHIPKYEALIRLLKSDHQEIDINLKKVKSLSQKLIASKADPHLYGEPVQEAGIYLVGLLQHHVQFEQEGIGKAFKKELNQAEKNELIEKTKNWFQVTEKLEKIA